MNRWVFSNSSLLYNVHLYMGFIAMCGFVLYDTQRIIDRLSHQGKTVDYVQHALTLFTDMVGMFVRLLVILAKHHQKKKSDDRKRERRSY